MSFILMLFPFEAFILAKKIEGFISITYHFQSLFWCCFCWSITKTAVSADWLRWLRLLQIENMNCFLYLARRVGLLKLGYY